VWRLLPAAHIGNIGHQISLELAAMGEGGQQVRWGGEISWDWIRAKSYLYWCLALWPGIIANLQIKHSEISLLVTKIDDWFLFKYLIGG
jgi:hypothetical protein